MSLNALEWKIKLNLVEKKQYWIGNGNGVETDKHRWRDLVKEGYYLFDSVIKDRNL